MFHFHQKCYHEWIRTYLAVLATYESKQYIVAFSLCTSLQCAIENLAHLLSDIY